MRISEKIEKETLLDTTPGHQRVVLLLFVDCEKELFLTFFSIKEKRWKLPVVVFDPLERVLLYDFLLKNLQDNFEMKDDVFTGYVINTCLRYLEEEKRSIYEVFLAVDVTDFPLRKDALWGKTLLRWLEDEEDDTFLLEYGILPWRALECMSTKGYSLT